MPNSVIGLLNHFGAEKSIVVVVNPPWWRTWWAYTIYVLIIGGGIVAFVHYRSQSLRRELEQRNQEKQVAELQQQKTELEMQALRAQMNPHFIFQLPQCHQPFYFKEPNGNRFGLSY